MAINPKISNPVTQPLAQGFNKIKQTLAKPFDNRVTPTAQSKLPITPTPQSKPAQMAPTPLASTLAATTNFQPQQAIPAQVLTTPTNTFNPPQPTQPVATRMEIETTLGMAQQRLNELKQQQARELPRQQVQGEISNLLNRDIVGEREALRAQAGIVEKEERARNIYNDMEIRKREFEKEIRELQQNERGQGRSALNAEINDLQERAQRELADRAIQYNVALGDFQAAERIVNAQIEDIRETSQNKLNALQFTFNMLQNDMSESEKLQAQTRIEEERTKAANQEWVLRTTYQNQLDTQRMGINAGLSQGSLTYDPTTNSFVDNRPQQQAQQQAVAMEQNIATANSLTEMISRADALLSNNTGLRLSSGVNKQPLTPWTANQKNNFLADANFIIENLTFDKLAEMKARGVTFGALSDSELKKIGDASNVLSSMARRENGRLVGFDGNQAKLEEEIGKIKNKWQSTLQQTQSSLILSPNLYQDIAPQVTPQELQQIQQQILRNFNVGSASDQNAKRTGVAQQIPLMNTQLDFNSGLRAIVEAVAVKESRGNYNAIGPVINSGMYKGDRAYGKYQVMSKNLPEWSMQSIGRVVTPQEFLNNPQIQDKIVLDQFARNIQRYGNVDDAVSVWFTGRPVAQAGNASDGYTTNQQYLDAFRKNIQQFI
jgi:hypothetical protein